MPHVSYPNLSVSRRSHPAFLKRVRVRYLEYGLELMLGLAVMLEFRVRSRVGVKVGPGLETFGVPNAWGRKG